jgi:4-hydroxyphenylpyruvate dioxygenase-like putative hemolysin
MDAAVAYYEAIGIGPWYNYPSLRVYERELEVPDVAAFFGLRFKFANLANVQIQLCAPPPGNTPQRKFLEARGEGVFHLGFAVPDIDAAEAAGTALGLKPFMRGRTVEGAGFTYFDTADHGAGITLEVRRSNLT